MWSTQQTTWYLRIKQAYHMHFYTKLGHGTCEIICITCECIQCTYDIDKPCNPGVPLHQQPRYKPVKYFIYWPVLGYFNNSNIINFAHTEKSSE